MPSLRLTRRAIDDIPHPDSGQVFYRDTLLSGFGLRVGKQSKVYFAEGQVQRQTCRVTIGRADVFAPEIARKKARALLGEMAEGRNPNAERKRKSWPKSRWPMPSTASSQPVRTCRRIRC